MSAERTARAVAWACVIATAILAASGLARSLWWDEVYTAWAYVLRGPDTIRDPSAYIANNHVLFSGLTWATSRVFGTSEVVLRLWAVVPGLLAMAWLTLLVGRRLDWTIAAVVAGLLALSPLHLLLVTEARGYGLVLLASVGMLAGAAGASGLQPRWQDDAILTASAAIGTATTASLALPAGIIAVVVLVRRRRDRLRIVALGGTAVVAMVALYAPLVTTMMGSVGAVGSRHGEPVTALSPLLAPARLLLLAPLEDGPLGSLLEDVELARGALGLLLAGLVLAGGILAIRRDPDLGWPVLVVPPAMIVASGLVGMHLLPRYLAGLLPAVVVGTAVALTAIVRAGHQRSRPATNVVVTAAVLALAVAAVPPLVAERTPRQALKDAARIVAAAEADHVLVTADEVAWRYYLRNETVTIAEPDELTAYLCGDSTGTVVVVEPMLGAESAPPCTDERGLVPVTLPQRAVPGFQRVWIPAGP